MNNVMEGLGIYKWTDGRLYEGGCHNSKPHGFGRLIHHDYIFEGFYENDEFHGFGIMKKTKGRKSCFKGTWVHDIIIEGTLITD